MGVKTVELLLDAKAVVGEGPVWDAAKKCLYWVDIVRHHVHVYDPLSGQDEIIDVGDYVGAVVPRKRGGLVAVLSDGFYHLDLSTKQLTRLAAVEAEIPDNRFNDGKCDAAGRFFAGTLPFSEDRPTGALYCLEPDLRVRKVLDGLTIANGLGWSPDNTRMYFIDTPTREVVMFDYDLTTGSLSNRRTAVRIEDGFPDGMTVDAQGMIWVAHWEGWKVSRWNPFTGERLMELALPVSCVTACTFGGSNLDELYITSASRDIGADRQAAQPHAGGVFRAHIGIRGQIAHAFSG
ncbi:regucalcin-like protein [Alicyclobacillus acidoterrestris]|uniref:SMP-30/gluconolactonase/LRE family protein n=1 Tax=Alicyclobacillus suci TaxID=2816080 RepID=UPI001194DC20|nr:SMP-30/gluconolactonase/LRE family protein [Alicyclobacillus suci]GEO26014.1 regucalcin-like protein [Alicyclobacillus acidoterrestris]